MYYVRFVSVLFWWFHFIVFSSVWWDLMIFPIWSCSWFLQQSCLSSILIGSCHLLWLHFMFQLFPISIYIIIYIQTCTFCFASFWQLEGLNNQCTKTDNQWMTEVYTMLTQFLGQSFAQTRSSSALLGGSWLTTITIA